MKSTFAILFFLLFAGGCVNSQTNFPVIENSYCDTIMKGEYCNGYAVIRNNSQVPVSVRWVTASISTFQPTYSKEIILPHKSTRIRYRFFGQRAIHESRNIHVEFSNDSVVNIKVDFFVLHEREGIILATVDTNDIVVTKDSTRAHETVIANKKQPSPVMSQSSPVQTPSSMGPVYPMVIRHPESDVADTLQAQGEKCQCNLYTPLYPGGTKLFTDSLVTITTRQIKPAQTGMIVVRFIIDEQGNLINPEIARSIDPKFEKALFRNMRLAGKWTPMCDCDFCDTCEGRKPVKSPVLQLPVRITTLQ